MTLLMVLAILFCVSNAADAAFLVKGRNVKVMPLGDSITLGKKGMVGGYRKILYEWLIESGYAITYVGKQNIPGNPKYPAACSDGSIPYHEGYGSIRTDMVLTGGTVERQTAPPLATTLEKFKPDVVLLMIGTNDILQSWQLDTLEERLGKIIDAIYASNPKTMVLVASIAPIGGWTYVAKETRATAYNAAIPGIVARQQALGHAIGFVDIHQAMSAKGALGNDMVHPSDMGYALMAQAWYKALTGEEAPAIVDPKNPLGLQETK
ncbi:MAG: GDSL-type esterase/lipase family protein [Chthoniobacteraceae bacterium]